MPLTDADEGLESDTKDWIKVQTITDQTTKRTVDAEHVESAATATRSSRDVDEHILHGRVSVYATRVRDASRSELTQKVLL